MKINMKRADDPEGGVLWARGGLLLGVLVSVAGNVANVCLTDSAVHVSMRIPGAVFWPIALFVGIEVMVRNRHRTAFTGYVARLLLLTVGVTTFTTSYVNLHAFMLKMSEPGIAQVTGPIGIDALMLGCTLMLLSASLIERAQEARGALTLQYAKPIGPMPLTLTQALIAERSLEEMFEALPEAPVSAPPARARSERAPRVSEAEVSDAQRSALTMLFDREAPAIISERTGVSVSVVRKMRQALTLIERDRRADVSALKLRPALVELMRKETAR